MDRRPLRIEVFHSFLDENEAEDERRAMRSQDERLREFEALQERMWGESWRAEPILKVATWEKIDW